VQEAVTVESRQLVENPQGLDSPEILARVIRLQVRDGRPHRLRDGWKLSLDDVRKLLRAARNWKHSRKGIVLSHVTSGPDVPEFASDVIKRCASVLEEVAEHERKRLVFDGALDLNPDDVRRWLRVRLDPQAMSAAGIGKCRESPLLTVDVACSCSTWAATSV
jgi:hypothetical protein